MQLNNETADIIEKESDDLFLSLIKERPCLYNKRMPEHHDKICTENAMQEIAFILNDSVENCEKKWKKFQAAYVKEKLLQEQETRSGAAASKRKKWPYFAIMKSFYAVNDSFRCSYSNIPKKTSVQDQSQFKYITSKKRKINNLNPVEQALNDVRSAVNIVAEKFNTNENACPQYSYDHDTLVGKLITARLNQLSPRTAKKRRKSIMKCLIENDNSDSDN